MSQGSRWQILINGSPARSPGPGQWAAVDAGALQHTLEGIDAVHQVRHLVDDHDARPVLGQDAGQLSQCGAPVGRQRVGEHVPVGLGGPGGYGLDGDRGREYPLRVEHDSKRVYDRGDLECLLDRLAGEPVLPQHLFM